MIDRYQNLRIGQIWDKNHQLQVWTKIEILVAQYWHHNGLISEQDWKQIAQVKPDFLRLQTIEKENTHEVAAFVEMLAEQIGTSGKWIHYGLTSNDVLDTSQNLLLKESANYVEKQILELLKILQKKAFQEKKTICLGRTHGVVAEPITVGYRFALWFSELQYHLQRLRVEIKEIDYVKILGPTGMSSHFPLQLGEHVAKDLQMKFATAGNQLFGRYRLVGFFNSLTNLAISVEKMAIDIRNLHRSEINEINEGFALRQKGSSAMPHKKNPVLCENICGLVRLLRSLVNVFPNTNLLWHERDLTNSAIERVAIPDFFHLLTTALQRFIHVLNHLHINHHQIKVNLDRYRDELTSHKVMLALIKNSNLDRNQAYSLVQKSSFTAKDQSITFMQALIDNRITDYLSLTQLESCFDLKTFLVHLDDVFDSIFTDYD